MAEFYDYGRFRRHVDAAARLLPSVLYATELTPADLVIAPDNPVSCGISKSRLLVLATPRGDLLLTVEVSLADDPTASDVVNVIAPMCFERDEMTINREPIADWLTAKLGGSAMIRFGRNVHQCVFPGGSLREQLLAASHDGSVPPEARSIVYRGTVDPSRGGRLGIRTPQAINNPGETLVAHGRGVSLIVGWTSQVEHILALVAMTNVSAIGVLHRARDLAFDALEENQRSRLESVQDARELVSRLSNQLNELQLDISFGVEAYIDSILIPELVFDSFQISMRDTAGLDVGLANTSRMIERLGTVIGARAAVLDAVTQDQTERRDRLFNAMLASVSLLALPPALLLAFFGANAADVDSSRSVLDLGRYWAAYAAAWLPFAVLLTIGFVLMRRIRTRVPKLAGFDGSHGGAVASVRVPAQRADRRVTAALPRATTPSDTQTSDLRAPGR